MKTPCSCFTTYHRHHRHPAGHRLRKSVHTGNGPGRKRCRSRSRAYYVPDGPGNDRVDRHRTRTWMGHRMRCPHIVVPGPAGTEKSTVSQLAHPREQELHLLLGIADIEGTHLVAPAIWIAVVNQRTPPSSADAFVALFPSMST